jgi:addiction module HigA family antidote
MKKSNNSNGKDAVLTKKMDIGSKEFKEFQAILSNRSRGRSINQKQDIELLAIKFKMEEYIQTETKDVKLVGDFLKLYLATFKIRQNKFATYIGLKPSNLTKLIKGERSLSHELALVFGRIFNNDPMLWLDIQDKNKIVELSKAKKNRLKKYSLNDLIKA